MSTSSSPDLVAFGHAVARLRRDRGWSIDRLAEVAGVSRKTVINVENAHKGVRLTTAHALATALDVRLAELVVALDPIEKTDGAG